MPTFGGIVVATGTEASGRRTLLEVVDELSRPVNAADTTVRALAGEAFRAAVRTMNRRGMWPWEVQDEEVTLTANNSFSTVNSAVKKPLAMHYLSATGGTRDQRLIYEPYWKFIERGNHNVTGQPFVYTIPSLFETGQVQWFPIPSATDYAKLTYYRVTPAPRSESETVEVPDYALEVYMAFAWVEFLKRLTAAQRPFGIDVAILEARAAFKQLSAHVNAPGDRSRWGDM